MFASRRDDDGQAARKATAASVLPADVAVHARGGARIHARNTQARASATRNAYAQARTHGARRKHVARTDDAQHVTKRLTRGQICVLWSKPINAPTARQSLKIRALQAAKRQRGQHARTHAQGARQAVEGREMYDGGDG